MVDIILGSIAKAVVKSKTKEIISHALVENEYTEYGKLTSNSKCLPANTSANTKPSSAEVSNIVDDTRQHLELVLVK